MNLSKAKEVLSQFSRLELGTFPTPLQPMRHLQKTLGVEIPLYIKRDDLTGLGAGGNKVRNLEYLLGDMKQKGGDILLASGKSQSNLCALAVSACCKVGVKCIIVHNDQPPRQKVGNQLLNHLSGAHLNYIGDVTDGEREEYVVQFAQQVEWQGHRPYFNKFGASSALDSLESVHASVE